MPPPSAPPPRAWPWRLGVLAATAVFVGIGLSTDWARLAALRTVEPYGMAVHEQLLYNFSHGQGFTQTIHRGYAEGWMWSGHKAGTLPLVGLLYGLLPTPFWLMTLMVGGVALGALPAAALGRHALRHPAGLGVGALLYLGCPAVLATALQDYQDLVFALPLFMLLLWVLRTRRHPAWVALAALAACLPREECIPVVAAAAVVTFDPTWEGARRRWLRNLAVAAGVAALYGAVLAVGFPADNSGYDVPMTTAVGGLFDPEQIHRLFGLPWFWDFYALAWAPVGVVGLLAPLTSLPGMALVLLHMTIPYGLGVDRAWGRHVHHLAPALPFLVAAAILGLGRLWRWLHHERLGAAGRTLRWALVASLLLVGLGYDLAWARAFNLVLSPWPRLPTVWHPAWSLLQPLPPEAVPIVPVDASVVVSNRARSYTFSESLPDKAAEQGLGAGTHLLVHRENAAVLAWGQAMPGARVVGEAEPFLLLTWDTGAADPTWASWGGRPPNLPSVPWQLGDSALPPGSPPRPAARSPSSPSGRCRRRSSPPDQNGVARFKVTTTSSSATPGFQVKTGQLPSLKVTSSPSEGPSSSHSPASVSR
ncbi:MAG: DUF2079 domain-containing protein [Pseudomonadota bacterium]